MELSEYRSIFNERPCDDAIEWLKTQPDIQTAWQNCKRGDWMIWALRYGGCLPSKRFWVRLARRCAKAAKKYAAYAYANAYADAAVDAADYSAAAAAADDAAADTYAAAAAAEHKLQAEWIREHIPNWPLNEKRP